MSGYPYSERSRNRLGTARKELQEIFTKVSETYNNSIICGFRPKEDQDAAYNAIPPNSKVKWPDGKHNRLPSDAVDSLPYPTMWKHYNQMYHYAGFVLATALSMGYVIRWGGDWDNDNDITDNGFQDLAHFEWVGYIEDK